MAKISIRELDRTDYHALAEFNARFPSDTRSKQEWLTRFKYWWDNNPAYDESWQRGFLLLDDEEIVGFVGSFPTLFKAGDEIIKAFNGTTWRVLEPYRKHSIELWTCNREVSKFSLSFNTTPTSDVVKMITRLKYKKYSFGKERFSYLIGNPISYSELLPRKLPRWLRQTIAYMLAIYQQMMVRSIPGAYSILREQIDPEDVTHLWERTKDRWAYTNVRDRQAIAWYSEGKDIKFAYNGSTLVAYGIYNHTKHNRNGGITVSLVDFWYDDQDDLYKILMSFINDDRSQLRNNSSISSIRYPHFSQDISDALGSLRLFTHDTQFNGFVRLPNGSDLELRTENSYFTLLQGDYGV